MTFTMTFARAVHLGIAASLALGFSVSSRAIAQTGNQVTYLSAEDDALNINSVAVTPAHDNVNGIYAAPLEKFLKDLVANDKNWSLAEFSSKDSKDSKDSKGSKNSKESRDSRDSKNLQTPNKKALNSNAPQSRSPEPEDYEDTPSLVKAALEDCHCRGFFTLRISKGPQGLNARLTLLTGPQGFPLIQENFQDQRLFEIPQLKEQIANMYQEIKRKLPYRGLILSRRGNELTLDLGTRNGISTGTEISIAQIVKVNRHPKLKFMVSVEKEIIGKIRITKADDFLSFASVSFEKEPGVIRVGGKVLPTEFISYPTPILSSDGEIVDLVNRKDRTVAFGKDPKEWLPVHPPQYGKLALLAGLGIYSQSNSLSDGTSADGSTSLAPHLSLLGEFWLSTNWFLQAATKQALFQIGNSLQGSSPAKVDMSLSQYDLAVGYNFLLLDDFFGPKLQTLIGYDTYTFDAGATSPRAFTKMSYSALSLGFTGSFDVSPTVPLQLGAFFKFYLAPTMTESPVSSGSSSNKLNSFGFFGTYKMSQNYNIRGELNFDYFTSNFSGTGSRTNPSATSSSHRYDTLSGGLEYLF